MHEIENEIHFITQCPQMPRKGKHFDACLENAENFEQIHTNLQKYIFILSNENNDVIHALTNYVHM